MSISQDHVAVNAESEAIRTVSDSLKTNMTPEEVEKAQAALTKSADRLEALAKKK